MDRLLALFFTLVYFAIFWASSCQPKKSAREKLYFEVMEIHDEVMPEMGTIHRLKKQLKAIDTTTVKSSDYPTILTHLTLLEKADEGMMGWMAEFDNPTPDTDETVALKYLEKEKIKISEVRDQMRESIASAKIILLEAKSAAAPDSLSIK